MSWIELSTYATTEAIDWIRTLLASVDYSGEINISKPIDSDLDNSNHSVEETFLVQFYLPDQSQSRTKVTQVIQQLATLERTGMITALQSALVQDLPSTSEFAAIHQVGRFVILPSNSSNFPLNANDIPLKVEQTLAFGSGFHPATVLSLKLIERYVSSSMTTLDLGCGSGILSVAMAKLGANVTAIDNDRVAIAATQTMIQNNDVTQSVTTFVGSLGNGSSLGHWMGDSLTSDVTTIQPDANFDLIVANIFARIHISLVQDYHKALYQNPDRSGLLITAGYDIDYEAEIKQTFAAMGFKLLDTERLGSWVAHVHQRQSDR